MYMHMHNDMYMYMLQSYARWRAALKELMYIDMYMYMLQSYARWRAALMELLFSVWAFACAQAGVCINRWVCINRGVGASAPWSALCEEGVP